MYNGWQWEKTMNNSHKKIRILILSINYYYYSTVSMITDNYGIWIWQIYDNIINIMDWKLFAPFWSVVVRLIFYGMESVGFKQ